jgi:phenol hydroxylase P0 protein
MPISRLPPSKRPFDIKQRYVRFQRMRADGYVEFSFAIGEPELAVDLILPLAAYREFCRANKVTYLTIDEMDHKQTALGAEA